MRAHETLLIIRTTTSEKHRVSDQLAGTKACNKSISARPQTETHRSTTRITGVAPTVNKPISNAGASNSIQT